MPASRVFFRKSGLGAAKIASEAIHQHFDASAGQASACVRRWSGPAFALDNGPILSDISVMAEISDSKKLSSAIERFVLYWGDMGDEWGVNRSVSQIHGLLYLSEMPRTAEDIAEQLGMARSNVSNSIKKLLSWNLIRRVPILGDRRDHFEAETDIWEVAARIAAGRKQREIDPAIEALRACVADAANDPNISPVASKRLKEMLTFTETVDGWFSQMLKVPRPKLIALVRLGAKIVSYLPAGKSK
jgi:DNA-binding transcriptional regulator GbsR (MarR family)